MLCCFVMRFFLYFLVFLLFAFGQKTDLRAQQKDSVSFYLTNAKDSLKTPYLKKAYSLSQKLRNDSLLKKSSIALGLDSYFKRDTVRLKKVKESLISLYRKNTDSFSLAKAYHFRALIFRIQNRLDSSFYHYYKSKEISILLKDSLEVGRRCLSMSYMQKDGKDYAGAEATIVEGLNHLEPLGDLRYTPESYNSLGHILLKTGRYDEAIKYYNKVLETVEKRDASNKDEDWNLLIANNIGNTYLQQNKPQEALPYFRKALEFDSIALKYPYHYQLLLGNYSDANYLLGNTKEAWEDFWKLLRFREKNKNIFGQGVSHNGFAYYYMLEGNPKKALYHSLKSYELTKKVNNNFTRASVLIKLVKLTSGKKAERYFDEHLRLTDSLEKIELSLRSDFTTIRYETEKKEQENITLKLENEKKQAAVEKAEQQRIIGWLVAIALFLTLGSSVMFFINRRKKLLYESQLEKANAREQERQQIAKSLHDEVAGDLRMLHQKLAGSNQQEEANGLEKIKENVRNLSHQLSSVSFEEVSFKDQMINLATDYFSKDFKVFIKGLDLEGWEEVNETIKRTLYLSVRESLQNALRYAEASRFDILFSLHKKEVLVSAKDNGKGFDTTKEPKGIGLKNMEERVQELRGHLDIESSENGSQIKIRIPRNGK